MDAQAWLERQEGEDAQERYQYFMRPDPDQREFLGPIETEYDDLTDTEVHFRVALIGMVRGAKRENMKQVKVYLKFDGEPTIPHIRIDDAKPLQGWYQDKEMKQGSRPRPCFSDAVLTEPYGGYCTVGCQFCYINSGMRGYRGSGLVTVPVRYGEQVEAMLARMRTATAGYFSSFTDPFLPLESYYHNTREGAEAFDREGLPIFFLSRLPYPGWAIDLLERNDYSYAQKSLNTSVEEDWRKLSPGALPLADHLDEIRELSSRGIYVSIQVNPIIPGVTSHDEIERLFELLAEAGADHVIVKFVEAQYAWANAMVEKIQRKFPERGERFAELFTENSCGAHRTVVRDYRLDGHLVYQAKANELGLTYATCYEFDRDEDGEWRSIGRDWITADQCHGQRVPMHTRPTPDSPFEEVEECPPTGCLYCADDNDDEPRCGSELYGAAKALRMSDWKQPVYQIEV